MADFVFDPLRIGAMLFLGSATTDLNVPSAASLTLTGLAPSLSFQLRVPSTTVQASRSVSIPTVDGGAATFTYTLDPAIAIGAEGNSWVITANFRNTGTTLLEARLNEVPSTANPPVWTAATGKIGLAVRDQASFTVQDLITELASIGVTVTTASSLAGVLGGGDQAITNNAFSGGLDSLAFSKPVPSLSVRLAVPSTTALALTGLAPSLDIRLGIQSTTALVLSGKQPSLNTGAPDGSNTLIGPVVGARIGPKIDPGVGG